MLGSYPKVYALGHRAISGIFGGPVVVQEKIDGSQISFGVIDGELSIRSSGRQLVLDAPDKLFLEAVEVIKAKAANLKSGWVYRGEYLKTPRHNTLAYDRIPKDHIIMFDIETSRQAFLSPELLNIEAGLLGFESAPVLYQGVVEDPETLKSFLETVSVLGGQKIEGVVVKNYNLFTLAGKVALGKYVSKQFEEHHRGDANNPPSKNILESLIEAYRTPARWNKAIQRLRERGQLDDSPWDIAPLIREILADLLAEEEDAIKQALFDYYWPKIQRGVTSRFPEYYKDRLLEKAFEES